MTVVRLLRIALLTTMAVGAAHAQNPADPPGAAAHFAKARQVAGNDPYLLKWIEAGPLCKAPPVHRSMMEGARAPGRVTPREPVQLFDNLYMVGNSYVVSLILKTSAGLVMFDTMNNTGDVRTLVEPGMAKFGLDPADIKFTAMAITMAAPRFCRRSIACRSAPPRRTGT
jgi:metallo-beta-lactamase class B